MKTRCEMRTKKATLRLTEKQLSTLSYALEIAMLDYDPAEANGTVDAKRAKIYKKLERLHDLIDALTYKEFYKPSKLTAK